MQTSYYVYIYLDPRKSGQYVYGENSFPNEPFYVGKGKDERATDHLKEVRLKRPTNVAKCNKIRAIYKAGMVPIILKLKEGLDNDGANCFEKQMIGCVGRLCLKTGPLTNITDGGDGGDTFTDNPRKELTRIKMSIRCSGTGNPMHGKTHTSNSLLKMSQNRTGIRRGVHPWNYGKTLSETHKLNLKLAIKPENNAFAKTFQLTSPDGVLHEVKGSLRKFCNEHKLSHSFMRYSIGKGVIPPPVRKGSEERKNLTGWRVEDMGYINQ